MEELPPHTGVTLPGKKLPPAVRIPDEMGRMRTLSRGASAYEHLLPSPVGSRTALVLGLGPSPGDLSFIDADTIYFLECPDFAAAMPAEWQENIPAGWLEAEPSALADLVRSSSVWHYRQGTRLFSSFWGPVLAAVQAARLGTGVSETSAPSRMVLLPGNEHSLLTQELEQAFLDEGLYPVRLPEDDLIIHLPALLREARPALLLSVNGRSLDPDGSIFHLLQAHAIPTAIWMVDNPWHVLSAWRQPWWRKAHLFVTDASFIPDLQDYGARHAAHLPLGAWMRSGGHYTGPDMHPVVFVGRSTFPDKEKFFSGLRPNPLLWADAQIMMTAPRPQRPDFAWWAGYDNAPLWPGTLVRRIGCGAENCSQEYRTLWLQAARDTGLTVFGDKGWRDLLATDSSRHEELDLRAPLDYYSELSNVYAEARYSLNLTSLLLPAGLTQRHFDVWTAGGFLLTDSTPGLDIFPRELTEPIRLSTPQDLAVSIARFEREPALYRQIQCAWQSCLTAHHTIRHRIRAILEQTLH